MLAHLSQIQLSHAMPLVRASGQRVGSSSNGAGPNLAALGVAGVVAAVAGALSSNRKRKRRAPGVVIVDEEEFDSDATEYETENHVVVHRQCLPVSVMVPQNEFREHEGQYQLPGIIRGGVLFQGSVLRDMQPNEEWFDRAKLALALLAEEMHVTPASVQAAFRREGSQLYWLYAGTRVLAAAVIVPAPNLETILITHLATTGALRNHGLMASLIERIFDAQPDPWCVELLGFFRSQPIGNAPAQTDALHALIGLALQKDWSYHFAADPSDIDPVLSHLLEEDDLKLLAQICPCVTGVRSIRSLIAFGYTPLLISTRGFLLPDQFEETRIVLSTFSEAASSSSVYMPTPSVASTYNARLSLLPAADGSLSASILVTPEAALQPVCLCSTRGFKLPTIAIIAHYSSEYCRLPRLTESGVPPLPRSWLFPRLFACLAMSYASGLAARTPLTSMHIVCAIQCCLDKLKFWLLCLVMLSLQIMSIACKSSVTTLYQTSNYMLASLLCFLVWLPGTSAMGLVFANSPATGDALRAARDEHLVYALTGCLALAAFVPALGGRVVNPNQHVYPLRAILWLLLPCTRLHATVDKTASFLRAIVHPRRLGLILESLIAAGLDLSACTPGVARKRCQELAARLWRQGATSEIFEAVPDDLYAVQSVADVLALPGANYLTLLRILGDDGSLAALGDLELVMHPRILAANAIADNGGVKFLLTLCNHTAVIGLDAESLFAFGLERVKASLPDPLLSDFLSGPAARIELRACVQNNATPPELDVNTIHRFMPHLTVIGAQITTYEIRGEAMLRCLTQLQRVVLKQSNPIPSLGAGLEVERALSYLGARLVGEEYYALTPQERVNYALSLHHTATEQYDAGYRNSNLSAGEPVTGYGKAYRSELRLKLNGATFLAHIEQLEEMSTNGTHPFVMIEYIFMSREVIFWHALLGKRTALPGVPLVAWISSNLCVHGPNYLGHLAQTNVLPPPADGAPEITPPVLNAQWDALKKGDLIGLRLEQLYYDVMAHGSGALVKAPKIPDETHFTNLERLRAVLRLGVPFFTGIGFPSDSPFEERSLGALLGAAIRYHEDGVKLKSHVRMQRTRKAILGCLMEQSALLKDALGSDDPSHEIGGALIINGSFSFRELQTRQAHLPGQNALAVSLSELQGQEGATVTLDVPGLETVPRTKPRAGTSQEETDKTAEAKAKAEAEKARKEAEKIKKPDLEVGSLSHYVEYSKDGKSFSIASPEGRAEGKITEFDLAKFRAEAGPTACPEVWCSTHRNPWALCTHSKKAGHTTNCGGAHAVSAGFPKKAAMCLLAAAAAGTSDGARVPTSFCKASCPALHPFGIPLMSVAASSAMRGVALVPVSLTEHGCPRIGLPAGQNGMIFGTPEGSLSERALLHCQRWSDTLFAPRTDAHAHWFATVDGQGDIKEQMEIFGVLVSDPPPPLFFERRIDDLATLAAMEGPAPVWPSLDSLCDSPLYLIAATAISVALRKVGPMAEPMPTGVTLGALAPTRVAFQQTPIHTMSTKISWDQAVCRARHATDALRLAFTNAINNCRDDPEAQDNLVGWVTALHEPNLAEVPSALRLECREADDPRLANIAHPMVARPVPSDPLEPLPPPPDQSVVPRWATDWHHALLHCFLSTTSA